jgi:hypothetical protein
MFEFLGEIIVVGFMIIASLIEFTGHHHDDEIWLL